MLFWGVSAVEDRVRNAKLAIDFKLSQWLPLNERRRTGGAVNSQSNQALALPASASIFQLVQHRLLALSSGSRAAWRERAVSLRLPLQKTAVDIPFDRRQGRQGGVLPEAMNVRSFFWSALIFHNAC